MTAEFQRTKQKRAVCNSLQVTASFLEMGDKVLTLLMPQLRGRPGTGLSC